jgi:hypothetical protein
MATKPKSLYLTERTMSALRPGDALSGRMNQIAERYLTMIEEDAGPIRDQFSQAAWTAMLAEVGGCSRASLDESREALAAVAPDDGIDNFTAGDLVVLIELLEGDRVGAALLDG